MESFGKQKNLKKHNNREKVYSAIFPVEDKKYS